MFLFFPDHFSSITLYCSGLNNKVTSTLSGNSSWLGKLESLVKHGVCQA